MKKIITVLFVVFVSNAFSQSEPSWINNYPFDTRYYTGIGTSNSGNKSDDYERALVQARLNLAAEISTNISAETEVRTSDSSQDGLSESFTEKINQSVEQYLKELEIVDTFYSRSQGYWVYIRLNKNRWLEIQENEMFQLLSRIQQIIDDDYFSNRATTADRLFKLSSASAVLHESPYSSILEGELGDYYKGNIFDFILSELFSRSSDISISIDTVELTIESGDSIEFRITCKSADYYIGKIPVTLKIGSTVLRTYYSDINGNIPVRLESNQLNSGQNTLEVSINPHDLGFPEDAVYRENFVAGSRELAISVESSSIFLSIETNKTDLDFLEGAVGSLFSTGNEKFNLSEDKENSSYNLVVSLDFSDFPKVLENAPLMAGLDCIISLKKDNRVLFEYKNDTLKDGGLSYDQAYRRVFNKLIRALEQDRSYIRGIENILN